MAYFEWASDMEIDRGPIDEDHQHLVGLVNRLHDATSVGEGHQVVGDILKELIDYTEGHLRREEQLMAQAHFPKLDKHKIGHQAFISQLNELRSRYDGGSVTVASQLSRILRDWLSLHIRRSDKELYRHLQGNSSPRR